MQRRRLWRHFTLVLLVALLVINGGNSTAFAVTANSPHYQVTETQFGASSNEENCSGQYCARTSIGDMAVGEGSTEGGSATFGAITDDQPLLEVIVDPGVSNLGVLSTENTATKTTTVKVRTYLSNGYILQVVGTPPKYGTHTLKTPSTPTASQAGTEQFAINAAANTSPSVGAGPLQVPTAQTSFGVVDDDYKTPNVFKYTSGDVVARSQTASGQTDYTISMIVNVSNATPAGHYSGDFSAVVIPVY